MAAPYRDISRAAYVMAADATPLSADYRALAFPEHWHRSVLALCNRGRPPEAEPYRTVPTYRMDGVLQSLAPDLIVRGRPRESQQQDSDFWLYLPASAPSPFPGDAFDRLAGAWLRDLRPEPDRYRDVLATLSDLRATSPWWENITLDLLACPTTDGGTAAPLGYQYQLATDAIARRILSLGPYATGAGTLHFRASPRGPRQQGAELISQPLQYVIKGQAWWFSILINISLHTAPFDPRPRLHLHTGVRRWATRTDPKTGQIRLPLYAGYLRLPQPHRSLASRRASQRPLRRRAANPRPAHAELRLEIQRPRADPQLPGSQPAIPASRGTAHHPSGVDRGRAGRPRRGGVQHPPRLARYRHRADVAPALADHRMGRTGTANRDAPGAFADPYHGRAQHTRQSPARTTGKGRQRGREHPGSPRPPDRPRRCRPLQRRRRGSSHRRDHPRSRHPAIPANDHRPAGVADTLAAGRRDQRPHRNSRPGGRRRCPCSSPRRRDLRFRAAGQPGDPAMGNS